MLARYAAIAIDNARRIEDLSDRRDELERTLAAMRATSRSRALSRARPTSTASCSLIAKRGRALVGARVLVIELALGDRLRIAAAAGDIDRDIVGSRDADGRRQWPDGCCETRQRTAAERRPQPRALRGDRASGSLGLSAGRASSSRSRSAAETPGVLGGARIRRTAGSFSDEDERLLDVVRRRAPRRGRDRPLGEHRAAASRARRRPRTSGAAGRASSTTRRCRGSERCGWRSRPRVAARIPSVWRGALDDAVAELDTEIANVRGIIADVRPAALDELGTEAAIEALADRIRHRGDRRRSSRSTSTGRQVAPARARRRARDGGLPDRSGGDDQRPQALGSRGRRGSTVLRGGGYVTVRVATRATGSTRPEARAATGSSACANASSRSAVRSTIESAPGAGTTVTVRLPALRLDEDQGTTIAGTPANRSAASSRRM